MSVMNKIKVSEATNLQLDWLVWTLVGGAAAYPKTASGKAFSKLWHGNSAKYIHPSTDWSHLGPIIERNFIALRCSKGQWYAMSSEDLGDGERAQWAKHTYRGGKGYRQCRWNAYTPLVAATKCYVASKLGDTVEVPEELT